MIGKKLFKLLQILDPVEFRRLRKAFQSPFFTTNERHLVLYDMLKKHYPEFNSTHLEKERIFKKIYPQKEFNDGLMRVLVREFTAIVEEYFIILHHRKDTIERKHRLVKIFGERNQYEFFEKGTNSLLDELESSKLSFSEILQKKIDLKQSFFSHSLTSKFKSVEFLTSTQKDIDHYYLTEKIRAGCDFQIFKRNFQKEYKSLYRNEFINLRANNKFGGEATINVYYQILLLLESEEEQFFPPAKSLFLESINEFKPKDQKSIFHHLLNFAVIRSNKGQEEYKKVVFNLYKVGLEHKILLENNTISDTTYNNIAFTGTFMGAYEWTLSFIQKYSQFLDPKKREETENLAIAVWNFYQNKHPEVIDILLNQNFQSLNRQILSKTILLRSYFSILRKDNSYYQLFESYANSFEKFLRRKDLMAIDKANAYLKFIKLSKRLAKRFYDNTKHEDIYMEFSKILEQEKGIAMKSWLFDQLESIKKRS